jgi:hypothetical protein
MTEERVPSTFDEFMAKITDAWHLSQDLAILRRLDNGRSGAYVAVVDVRGQDFNGQAILKLSEDDRHDEKDRHERAVKFSGRFAEKHIPPLMNSACIDRKSALLVRIVEGGLNFTQAFTRLPHGVRLAAGQTVSESILVDWNKDYRIAPSPVAASELMGRWLGHRLDPSSGSGRLHDLLSNELEIAPDCVAFHVGGHVLPDPLSHALEPNRLGDAVTLMPAVGAMHGDLHGDNVLVGEMQKGRISYYLIDLADFEENTFLFFDNAYLETSICIDERSYVPLPRWRIFVLAWQT